MLTLRRGDDEILDSWPLSVMGLDFDGLLALIEKSPHMPVANCIEIEYSPTVKGRVDFKAGTPIKQPLATMYSEHMRQQGIDWYL